MEIPVIEKIQRLPRQTEESLRDAFSVLRSIEDRKSVDHYVRWVRDEAKKIPLFPTHVSLETVHNNSRDAQGVEPQRILRDSTASSVESR